MAARSGTGLSRSALAQANPFDKVKDFDIPNRGHVPWPAWVVDYVRQHAWPDLVRMARLGIMTCQRGSDMVRMGPEHRERNGIWCWGRWLDDTTEGRELCRCWKEWVGAQVKKYDWDIDPDDADHPTIHGLRGTGIPGAPSKATRSTRSPTTSGCHVRTSNTICASETR